jgi:nuclease HARBI1
MTVLCFQIVCGDLHKISQPVACKIIGKISTTFAMKVGHYVKFPLEGSEQAAVRVKFYQMASFPGARGCIDCTHIPIKNPNRERGEIFRNRKGTFSINVQLVCGPDLKIYDIVARWPGSVHDARIFGSSRVCLKFDTGTLTGLLIGDSGYAQNSYMFTPVINPVTESEHRYNRAHITTRNIVERLIGVWKRRFACLSRKLQNNIHNTLHIIVSCAVLHNICVQVNEADDEANPALDDIIPNVVITDTPRGSLIRRDFIRRHFSQS